MITKKPDSIISSSFNLLCNLSQLFSSIHLILKLLSLLLSFSIFISFQLEEIKSVNHHFLILITCFFSALCILIFNISWGVNFLSPSFFFAVAAIEALLAAIFDLTVADDVVGCRGDKLLFKTLRLHQRRWRHHLRDRRL